MVPEDDDDDDVVGGQRRRSDDVASAMSSALLLGGDATTASGGAVGHFRFLCDTTIVRTEVWVHFCVPYHADYTCSHVTP